MFLIQSVGVMRLRVLVPFHSLAAGYVFRTCVVILGLLVSLCIFSNSTLLMKSVPHGMVTKKVFL
jgi:hypothetical protein